MTSTLCGKLFSLSLWAFLVCPAHAVPFTFVGTPVFSEPGTVTGTIFGLVDNMPNQAATQIVITSFPAGLAGTPQLIPTDYFNQSVNSFSVVGGVVTAAEFSANDTLGGFFFLNFGPTTSLLTFDNGISVVGNVDGFGGITFGPLNTGVPEIDTASAFVPLMLTLGVLGTFQRRRRSKIGAASDRFVATPGRPG